jgi:hypothetical protein
LSRRAAAARNTLAQMVEQPATAVRAPSWRGYAVGFAAAPVLFYVFLRLAGVVAPEPADPRSATALATARSLIESLERYRARHQRFPSAKDGLHALVPDQLEWVPLDPWGRSFVYEVGPQGMADVRSLGGDGLPGGRGEGADISGRFGIQQDRPPDVASVLGQAAFFGVLVTGFLGARRWPWAAGLLSGSGIVCAVLLLAAVRRVQPSFAVLLPFAVAICCIAGSVALFRRARGAPTLTFTSVFVAYLLLSDLIST